MSELNKIALKIISNGKGILAADESNGTMSKRLEAVGIEPSEENRRKYRVNLFASDNYEKAISGIILYDETIRQKMDDGTDIPDAMIIEEYILALKSTQEQKNLKVAMTKR